MKSNKRAVLWGALLSMTMAASAEAMDTEGYLKLAKATVNEANGGFISNVNQMIAMQERMIQLGIEGIRDYARKHPEHAQLLNTVVENAENMKAMSLDEIEAQWHEGAFLKSKGFDLEKMDHFGSVFSLMDAVIHPATSYICFKEYKRTRDATLLNRASAELVEVMEHVAHIEPEGSPMFSQSH